ncbi:MAG: DUF4405 domain-containing protein [Deltaproteobacteria bacterium]|nr:DUF4405 domain-containing protein [Deltaproteobacteria bacterium]
MFSKASISIGKLVLDIIMTVSFLLLMEPRATGLPLHEWGGLGVVAFYLIHNFVNWPWIKFVSANLFTADLNAANRLKYGLDILLLIGFVLIIVSGMAIAKTIDFSWLFGTSWGGPWRGIHLLASLVTLIAVGIHVGLQWDWIVARFPSRSQSLKKEANHA